LARRLSLLVAAGIATAALIAPSSAFAATGEWQGNGYPSASCQATTTGTMLWVWTGDSPTALTINGTEYTGWVQQGGGAWHLTLTITASNYPPVTASVTYTGDAGTLTLSGCNEGATPTPTPTLPEETPGATPTPTLPEETPAATPTPTLPEETPVATPAETPSGSVGGETATPQVTPGGSEGAVEGETDVPTAPSTDIDGTAGPTGNSMPILLIVLGIIGLAAVVLTPARRRR